MAEKHEEGGVTYRNAGIDYFEDRELRRHAGVFYLWALGVAAVISGDFSGWNLGFAVGGWGGMFVGTIIITIMYLGLTYSIAEMSPALPHTGGAYSFARTAFGPWGGFITGVAENIEYVLTPAVIVYFIGTYLTAIFETPASFQPLWWIFGYIVFIGANTRGVELSFLVTVMVTLLAILILAVFFISAIPFFDFGKYAMNIGVDPTTGAAVELADGHGPFLPFGIHGVLEDQGHVMTRLREEVSTRMPRPEETRLLRLRPGVPVLDVWHTSLDRDGQPYELTRFVMRGDMTGLLYDVPVE